MNGNQIALICLEEIGNEYWSNYSDLESADESEGDELNESQITLSRHGPTKNLFKKVSILTYRCNNRLECNGQIDFLLLGQRSGNLPR